MVKDDLPEVISVKEDQNGEKKEIDLVVLPPDDNPLRIFNLQDKFEWPFPDLVDWCEAVDNEDPEEYLFEGLVPIDAAIQLSGPAKKGKKTYLAFCMIASLATGKSIGPFKPTRKGKVLIVELEGPRKGTRERWNRIQRGFGVEIEKGQVTFLHRYPVKLDDIRWVALLCDLVEKEAYDLVVLDSLAKIHTGDENSARDLSKLFDGMDRIRGSSPKTSVMFLHHLRKTSKEFISRDIDEDSRGSNAVAGYYDLHIACRLDFESQEWINTTFRSKDGEESIYRFKWYFDGDTVEDDKKAVTFTADKLKTYNFNELELTSLCAKIMDGVQYDFKRLCELWQVPTSVCATIVDGLEKHRLIKSIRGGKYVLDGEERY